MKKNEYKKKEIVDKINHILSVHRCAEVTGDVITRKQFDIVQNICWIKWEYDSYTRLKMTPERRLVISKLESSVNYLYERYLEILCLK